MNANIQHNIDHFRKIAATKKGDKAVKVSLNANDGLSKVIKNKKAAENFMADLELAFKRSKK
ncbi:MAG: hypothetical protein ACQUHE_14545 [Bacteroidia bacterium]